MTEVEQPPQNGIDLSAAEEDDYNKSRPADIEQDMREMERRKRVEAIMNSKLFREELERIVDSQIREGGTSGILQQLSDIVGVPTSRIGSVFKSSNCVLPINDIRGVESMGYAKGEKILRCKLAATFRLLDLYGWTQGLHGQITARLKVDQELFLVNPYGLLYHEITASSLNKVDMQGHIFEQGTTNFGINKNHFVLHSTVHAARPDIRCAIFIGCNPVFAISSTKHGLLPLTKDSVILGEISTHTYTGSLSDLEEREKLIRNLGPISKVLLLTNHGALVCGETIEETFFSVHNMINACETQLKLLPIGVDNLILIPEESRKSIYDAARRPPEDFEKKLAALALDNNTNVETIEDKDESSQSQALENNKDTERQQQQQQQLRPKLGQPKWRVGGAEFEALMRMLDNAGFRTGYIYRHPLVKSELPKPKNDVELPPAVSSLGYLFEEEELYRQGIWKKGDIRKGGDRSRWLNSPNVYQKVEVLETGTPDPKKITKWVAEGSPTHSTPVRIEHPLQFVPHGTTQKEFKKLQQQIKENRRADKISAGPQSHILEGVTWDEANQIKDATVSSAGDHVVLMGAASKGIIQRGYQHNASVYKAPYAKNPFDNVTDDELNEYKKTVERKKKNIHGEYTDTDFSESEALSSLQTSGAQPQNSSKTAVVSQSEPEDASEHQVMRIETKQAPVPSQPEVVLSDASVDFINGEKSHTAANKKLAARGDSVITIKFTNIQEKNQIPLTETNQCEEIQDNSTDITSITSRIVHKTTTTTITTSDAATSDEKNIPLHKKTMYLSPQQPSLCESENFYCNRRVGGLSLLPSPSSTSLHDTLQTLQIKKKTHGYYHHPLLYDLNYDDENHSSMDINYDNIDMETYFPFFKYSCCTPKICKDILKSVLKQHKMQSSLDNNKFNSHNNNNNCYSPTTTSSESMSSLLFDMKSEKSSVSSSSQTQKRITPYRTYSHFGFITPNYVPPKHKHYPIEKNQLKYVPSKNGCITYDEIFSSPRYVDLCENCFDSLIHSKLIFRLSSAIRDDNQRATNDYCQNEKDLAVDDYVPSDDSEVVQLFSKLEPVIEEEEDDIPDDDHDISEYDSIDTNSNVFEGIPSKTSFFSDKITRMNFSSESITSIYSQPLPTMMESSKEKEEEHQTHQQQQNSTSEYVNNVMNYLSPKTSIHDNNFSRNNHSTPISSNDGTTITTTPTDSQNNSAEKPLTDADNCGEEYDYNDEGDEQMEEEQQEEEDEEDTNETTNYLDCNQSSRSFEEKRHLMTRAERNQRKREFQEIWEDHVSFFSEKSRESESEENQSDNESGNGGNVKEIDAPPTANNDGSRCNTQSETFVGQSCVTKHSFSVDNRSETFSMHSMDTFKIDSSRSVTTTTTAATTDENNNNNIDDDNNSDNNSDSNSDNNYEIDQNNNNSDDTTDEVNFNEIERTILEKIEVNQLKEKELIFDKIEKTIRNKMTPSKLDLIIQQQQQQQHQQRIESLDTDNPSTSHANKKIHKIEAINLSIENSYKLKRKKSGVTLTSRSLSPRDISSQLISESTIKATTTTSTSSTTKTPKSPTSSNKLKSIWCPINVPKNLEISHSHSQGGGGSASVIATAASSAGASMSSKSYTRNFVVENIKNVSTKGKKLRRRQVKTENSSPEVLQPEQQQQQQLQIIASKTNANNSPIYSFQTRSLGSPRFWLSISSSPSAPSSSGKKHKSSKKVEKSYSSQSARVYQSPRSNVDRRINELGTEIDDLKPRLESYKRRINDYGDQISKVARNMEECIGVQYEIESCRQSLRDNMKFTPNPNIMTGENSNPSNN